MDRLRQCAEIWAATGDGATLAKLGRHAIGDSSYFTRPPIPQGPTTATLERFARYLDDEANWPEGQVPAAVREFAHVVGVSAAAGGASPGKGDGVSQGAVSQDKTSAAA